MPKHNTMYKRQEGTASASASESRGARGGFTSGPTSIHASGAVSGGDEVDGSGAECGLRDGGFGGIGVGRRAARVALYSGTAALIGYALHSEPPRAQMVSALQKLGVFPPNFTDFGGRAKYLTFLNTVRVYCGAVDLLSSCDYLFPLSLLIKSGFVSIQLSYSFL